MKKRVTIDTDNYTGACYVLENYLDGALADYEDGQVENGLIIEESINALELLRFSMYGYSAVDYRRRFEKAKEKKHQQE